MGVRRRPRQVFEVTGGNLALDLANTKERRPTARSEEHLHEFDDLVSWGEQAGAIVAKEGGGLRALAAGRPQAARAALARAIDLREVLFELFSTVAGHRPLPEPALARLNAALPAALARLRLAVGDGGAAWTWAPAVHLERVLWPTLRAAAALLTSPDRERVRECAARDCAWLFLDRSRNGSRRWCDMAVCGNREKARRFQSRSHRL